MFTNNYFPFIGGVPVAIYRLAKGLKKLKANPIIFAPSFRKKDNDDNGIDVIRVKNIGYYKRFYNMPIANIFSPAIKRIFEKRILILFMFTTPFGWGIRV